MALEKGTEEFEMFGDFFKICKKYWNLNDTESYWSGLEKEVEEFCQKYSGDIFSQKLIFSFVESQEIKRRKMSNRR